MRSRGVPFVCSSDIDLQRGGDALLARVRSVKRTGKGDQDQRARNASNEGGEGTRVAEHHLGRCTPLPGLKLRRIVVDTRAVAGGAKAKVYE